MPIFNPFDPLGQNSAPHVEVITPKKKKEPKPPKGTPLTRVLISLLVTAVLGFLYFYFELPALNFQNEEFYLFLLLLLAVFSVSMIVLGGFRGDSVKEYVTYTRKTLRVPFYAALALVAVAVVGGAAGWVVFRAKDYAALLPMEEGNFTEEVAEISFDQIPMLDDVSANNLANRKLGDLSDLVSQFTVNEASAQINYHNIPVRVTYLDYENFFKWIANRSEGIPAYMMIDMVTQEVTVVRLEEGIKYSPSEYFSRDLNRHLRFSYPTKIFGDVNFEIDEEGTPYWIASVVKKTIGLFGGEDIEGAVLMNAVTGESTYYDIADVPSWADRVCSADLIMEQYDYYGNYKNGFFNSLFGQKDCTVTTDGYNYIALNDDVWLYTGITSISSDRGNIGFILVNQRTKEARYYSCAGAEEESARSSAEGAVQQYNYRSTFPLLLNISGQPTYFMSLKDAAGLVKMYAMVNVQQYQIVATGYTVEECQQNYHELMISNDILVEETPPEKPKPELLSATGVIEEIRYATMDGDTYFFLRFTGDTVFYSINSRENPLAVILNAGDTVTVEFETKETPITQGVTVTKGE